MPQEEFFGWMRFYELEPFGRLVEDSYHEANMQLHYAVNSKQGAEIPRFFERDSQPKFVDDIERVSKEERELEIWFERYEMQRKAKIKRQQIVDARTEKETVPAEPAKMPRKPHKPKTPTK